MSETRIRLTYIGRRLIGKNIHHFYLDENNERISFSQKIKGEAIGAILEVTRTDTGVKAPYTFLMQSKSEDLQKWYNTDRASYDEYLLLKESSKKVTEHYSDAIGILKKRYAELPYTQRQLFINRIIVEITK